MKPFAYAAPKSLAEALAVMAEDPAGTRPLAGGTDLIPQLGEGRIAARLVIDIKGIPELNRLHFDPQDGLSIGATVPVRTVASHPAVTRHYPALEQGCSCIGSVMIRNRATLGGNVGNASPSADGIPPLIVHGADVVVAGSQGERHIPVEEVCTGPGRTALEPGEFIVSFHLPVPEADTASYYTRFTPRNEMDIAVVGVAAAITVEPESWTCRSARIALAAVAPTPVRAVEAEEGLVGADLSPSRASEVDGLFRQAAKAAVAAARPIDDVRASAAYRLHLVEVLTRRCLHGAWERLQSMRKGMATSDLP